MSVDLVELVRTIEAGRTYVTCSSSWTVERIENGMVTAVRDDGRMACFGLAEFAGWVVREIKG